eukprot:TRINITY_DN28119_c0_g1_i1.p1 TRINITY_DN28119_c0_g1~~TRINITY_DN28119_c0_g1_i1.p1  ORF type:complete len:290 (-),score=62.44 TRINITY_DN28119_c0_g1_i1:13-858(-)
MPLPVAAPTGPFALVASAEWPCRRARGSASASDLTKDLAPWLIPAVALVARRRPVCCQRLWRCRRAIARRKGSSEESLAALPQQDPQELLEELTSWLFGWMQPTRSKEMRKVQGVVQQLRHYAERAEIRAHEAEFKLQALQQERQRMVAELRRARKELQLLARYAADVEEERDAAKEALEDASRSGQQQRQELAQLSQRLSDLAGLEVVYDITPASASLPSRSPPKISAPEKSFSRCAPVDMSLEELRAECMVRGLSAEGSLAAVRGRVRAARARESMPGE